MAICTMPALAALSSNMIMAVVVLEGGVSEYQEDAPGEAMHIFYLV